MVAVLVLLVQDKDGGRLGCAVIAAAIVVDELEAAVLQARQCRSTPSAWNKITDTSCRILHYSAEQLV